MPDKLLANARSITQPQVNALATPLGNTAGNEAEQVSWGVTAGANAVYAILRALRITTASGHDSMALELRRKVDSTNHGFLRLTATATQIGFNATAHWQSDSSGHLSPVTDSASDFGLDAFRIRVAYLDNIELRPSASRTPASNGDVSVELTNNTTLTFKAKGSDGTVRAGTITLS